MTEKEKQELKIYKIKLDHGLEMQRIRHQHEIRMLELGVSRKNINKDENIKKGKIRRFLDFLFGKSD